MIWSQWFKSPEQIFDYRGWIYFSVVCCYWRNHDFRENSRDIWRHFPKWTCPGKSESNGRVVFLFIVSLIGMIGIRFIIQLVLDFWFCRIDSLPMTLVLFVVHYWTKMGFFKPRGHIPKQCFFFICDNMGSMIFKRFQCFLWTVIWE